METPHQHTHPCNIVLVSAQSISCKQLDAFSVTQGFAYAWPGRYSAGDPADGGNHVRPDATGHQGTPQIQGSFNRNVSKNGRPSPSYSVCRPMGSDGQSTPKRISHAGRDALSLDAGGHLPAPLRRQPVFRPHYPLQLRVGAFHHPSLDPFRDGICSPIATLNRHARYQGEKRETQKKQGPRVRFCPKAENGRQTDDF